MSDTVAPSSPRLTAVLRGDDERVTPLELFFDLVFVLAITQCTALIAHENSWEGIVKGLLVLGILWWAWVGYAWLTSVVDPEEGAVRLVIFAAMAALLVARCASRRCSTTERPSSRARTRSSGSRRSACSSSPAATTRRCAPRCSAWRSAPRSEWR